MMIKKEINLEELTQYQAKFIERLLKEQKAKGINANKFAESIGTTSVTVSRWKNGRNAISEHFAKEIHAKYPEYSIGEITGYRVKARERANAAAKEYAQECSCFEQLLKVGGIDEILKSDLMPWRVKPGVIANGDAEFARLVRGDETLTLTGNQYEAFKNELFAYARMRLDSMFERGCW